MSHHRPIAVVAEDQAVLRMQAADLLSKLGFQVLEAGHAAEAMQHLEAVQGAMLLYTDIDMPGIMDGRDLAHICVDRWPSTGVIVCSGCMPEEAEQLPDAAHFIAKPCPPTMLRRVLVDLRLT